MLVRVQVLQPSTEAASARSCAATADEYGMCACDPL